jgi:hypothetical protein
MFETKATTYRSGWQMPPIAVNAPASGTFRT